MHTGACSPLGQDVSCTQESTTECIRSPAWPGGQGRAPAFVLTVRSSSPPTALLAARGRAVQGWGLS